MRQARKVSARAARRAGHRDIADDDFHIMRDYNPPKIHSDLWVDMCKEWDTPEWRKRTASGRKNRKSTDSSGLVSRHMGGSIGYDEHRLRLRALLGHDPSFKELFYQTHLTADSKVNFWAGQHDADLDFCTARAKHAYETYERAMLCKYGEDDTQHEGDDVDVWVESQTQIRGKRTGRVFGIGSGDIHFVVKGRPSSGSSSSEYVQSQKQVQDMRTQIEVLQRDKEEMQRKQTLFENQMAEMMRQIRNNPGNPPNNS